MATLMYKDPNDGQFYPVVGGGNDHGNLGGLADDDHPQYLQKAGGTMTGKLTLASVAPTASYDAATKVYVDTTVVHNHSTDGYRKIWASTIAPTAGEGANGDVWMVYT
jgi:hypothetical protein